MKPYQRVLLLVAGLLPVACASVDPALVAKRARAENEFTGGNYIDAAITYSDLTEAEKDGSRERRDAQLRWALSLYRAGDHGYAKNALLAIDRDSLDGNDRRAVTLAVAGSALHEAREKNPVLVARRPENKDDYDFRRNSAIVLFQKANQHYNELLHWDSNDFDAHLGRAECFLRLAELQDVPTFLRTADKHIRACKRQRPGDVRCIFLGVRIGQENLGLALESLVTEEVFRDLDSSSATDLISALRTDQALSHDYHIAYRDVFLYVRNFRPNGTAQRTNDGGLSESARRAEWVTALVEILDRYQREGRTPQSLWGTESVRMIRDFVQEFQRRSQEGTDRNIERAEQIALERYDTESLVEALGLLKKVDKEVSEGNRKYMDVRKKVQTSLVKSLHDRAERLVDLQEWDLAERCLQQSAAEIVEEWWDSVSGTTGDMHSKITGTQERLVAVKRQVSRLNNIESLMRDGDAVTAGHQLTDVLEDLPLTAGALRARAESLLMAVDKGEVALRIVELQESAADLTGQGRAEEAVAPLREALDMAGESGWRDQIVRDLSLVHYGNGQHDDCLDVLHTEGFHRELRDDLLIGKCYYSTGRFNSAKEAFAELQELGLYSDVDLETLEFAGLTGYQSEDYRQSKNLLGRLRERLDDDQASEEVIAALLDSSRRLYQEWARSSDREQRREEATELLTMILDLDPADLEHRQQMGLRRYEIAIAENRDDLFRRAYDDLVAAHTGGVLLDDPQEVEIFGRLTACFGDLMPLAQGNTWTYSGPDEQLVLTIEGDYLEQRRGFPLVSTISRPGGTAVERGLLRKEDDVIERVFGQGKREQYPIPLRAPTSIDQKIIYTSKNARYRSTVTETGIRMTIDDQVFENCVRVVIEPIDKVGAAISETRDELIMAPGVGIVEWKKGDRLYLLRSFDVSGPGGRL
ncbi:MAG: tetratricopeptide (TPR) repeat protein [Chlamydiales bacterium]|jgi:tetratricopeptide (TPR) repeat protein